MIDHSLMEAFLERYCKNVSEGFHKRWESHTPTIYENDTSETIGGLVARQATLAIEFARNPGIWNGHIAPLVLRCMTDAHITLAWILQNPKERSREYVKYGLGQEKLFIEYLKNESESIPEGEFDDGISEIIEMKERWLDSQIAEWAIEVNVGSWSGESARSMALEADCESLYKFAYVPFSGVAHNMWQHVGIYNMAPCDEPLHKNHRIPVLWEPPLDSDYLYRSSKYVSRTYSLLDEKIGSATEVILPVEYFVKNFPRKSTSDESDG